MNGPTIESLEALDEEGLLTDELRAHLVMLRQFDQAMFSLESPKRKRAGRVEFLATEARGDDVGIVVLQDPLGTQLANTQVFVGELGPPTDRKRLVWSPQLGPLQFIDRATLSRIRRSPELMDRIVVLDPGKGERASWADLFSLCASSPNRVGHPGELAKSIIRGTSDVEMLKLWLSCPSTTRDPQRARLVRDQLERVSRANAAE